MGIRTLQQAQNGMLDLGMLLDLRSVEGRSKALDILIRKPRNQVEMLMDVAKGVDRRSAVRGKSVDLGGRRIIKKKRV